MPRRPSFQFYPADWLANRKLRKAAWADRGLWIDLMCQFHDSDEYGIIRESLGEIARSVGCHVNQLQSLIRQEILKGAPKGKMTEPLIDIDKHKTSHLILDAQEGPCWFSSRMLRDEFYRQRDVENGRLGGNPQLKPPPQRVNPPVNPTMKREGKVNHSGNGVGLEGERVGVGTLRPRSAKDAAEIERQRAVLQERHTHAPKRS